MAPAEVTAQPAPGRQLALSIDLERCTGCRACEVACKTEHGLGSDMFRNRIQFLQLELEDGTPRLDLVFGVCQQCERPACVRACASTPKAIAKNPLDGVVEVDWRLCTGCGECVKACPYNAISLDFRHQRAEKCNLCRARREVGSGPACVEVCPTRALAFGEAESLLRDAEAQGRQRRDLDHFGLRPQAVYLERLGGGPGGA